MDEIQSAANAIQLDAHMTALSPVRASLKTPEMIEHVLILQKNILEQIETKQYISGMFVWIPRAEMLLTNIANWRGDHCTWALMTLD